MQPVKTNPAKTACPIIQAQCPGQQLSKYKSALSTGLKIHRFRLTPTVESGFDRCQNKLIKSVSEASETTRFEPLKQIRKSQIYQLIWKVPTAFTVLLVFISPLLSQERSREEGQRFYNAQFALGLSRQPKMMDHLELLPHQEAQVQLIYEQYEADRERLSKKFGVNGYTLKDMLEDSRIQILKYGEMVKESLAPWQAKRLDQLAMQLGHNVTHGDYGLTHTYVKELLGLTDDQVKKLEKKKDEMDEKIKALEDEVNQDLAKIRKRQSKKTIDILSPEQQKKYREIIGEVFFQRLEIIR